MGDACDVISPLPHALSSPSFKPTATHIEDKASSVQRARGPEETTTGRPSRKSAAPPTDNQNTNNNNNNKTSISSPADSPQPSHPDAASRKPSPFDHASSRAESESEPSGLRHGEPLPEPVLTVLDGPCAGRAAAAWKESLVPIIHAHTRGMTAGERTAFFDRLLEDDKDRYLAPLGAYYFAHRDRIPDRAATEQARRRHAQAWKQSPRVDLRQQRLFRDWGWDDDDDDEAREEEGTQRPGRRQRPRRRPDGERERPRALLDPYVGPRGEASPDEPPVAAAACEHCVREEARRKGAGLVRRSVSSLAAPIVVPIRKVRLSRKKKKKQRNAGGKEDPPPPAGGVLKTTTTTRVKDVKSEEAEGSGTVARARRRSADGDEDEDEDEGGKTSSNGGGGDGSDVDSAAHDESVSVAGGRRKALLWLPGLGRSSLQMGR